MGTPPAPTAPPDSPDSPGPRRPWRGARIVLGVTGGIAAYKSVQLARDLTLLGAAVDVVLTRGAREFVRPLTFEAVTGRPALTELFATTPAGSPGSSGGAGGGAARHIRLGHDADLVMVAPATADFLARAAQGRADDLLTTTLLATRAPVLLCPAMNDRMWTHPQVRANAAHCAEGLGYRLAGPGVGRLAHGEGEGAGRMLEPEELVEHAGRALAADPRLHGRTVLVTAGPTREPVDPVRYLGNRSSGRMGWAVARAAWRRGADVVLVAGPVALPDPPGVEVVRVETAREMEAAVSERLPGADVAVFAAAVADYRAAEPESEKIKTSRAGDAFSLDLVMNPDVAADTRSARRDGAVTVGFALETDDLVANARAKLEAKGFDLVVANRTGEGTAFEAGSNRVTLLTPDGEAEEWPLQAKDAVAEELLDRILVLLEARETP